MGQVKATPNVFKAILDPLLPLLREESAQLKDDARTYRLSLAPFVTNLVFAVLNNIKSISLLVTAIETSTVARELALTSSLQVNVFGSLCALSCNNLPQLVSLLA